MPHLSLHTEVLEIFFYWISYVYPPSFPFVLQQVIHSLIKKKWRECKISWGSLSLHFLARTCIFQDIGVRSPNSKVLWVVYHARDAPFFFAAIKCFIFRFYDNVNLLVHQNMLIRICWRYSLLTLHLAKVIGRKWYGSSRVELYYEQ